MKPCPQPRICTLAATSVVSFLMGTASEGAVNYGIYDARGLAMGGVTVAAGTKENAVFYNAALLAFYNEREEKARNSRLLFPILVPQASQSAIDIGELASDEPDLALSRSISDYNTNPNQANARAVASIAGDLEQTFSGLADEDVLADIYVGVAGIQPSKRQGGGSFFGGRIIGGGRPEVSNADLQLLNDYREGLTFIASGGTEGSAHAELFDANGALLDPNADLDSRFAVRGAAIFELGIAMSNEFEIAGRSVAMGMNVKVMRVETFEEADRLIDSGSLANDNQDSHLAVNLDVGAAKEFGSKLRLGIGVKDLIPREFDTGLGNPVKLMPRPRLGASYQAGTVQIGLDVDLARNEPLGTERTTQEAALGAEWLLRPFIKLRAGYRYDLQGNRDDIVSVGVGSAWKRFLVDVAYADGSDARAAALQFGYVF